MFVHRRPARTTLLVSLLVCVSVAWAPAIAQAADAKPDLTGKWELDASRSIDKVPTAGKRSSTGVHVGVAGMPVPTPEAQSPALGTPRDPDVMHAQEFNVDVIDGIVHLRFAAGREIELTQGNKQGVKTKWSGNRLTTSYQTTRRTVSQDYKLTAPDELTVVVKVDPKDEGATVHTRVFKRVST